jgi:hypothetical protein
MGRSPLIDIHPARDAAGEGGAHEGLFGPSDTSDSGSDVAVVPHAGRGDPGLPVDRALADAASLPLKPRGDSDSGGAGERRSAAGDGGDEDGADIGTDRIVDASEQDIVDENVDEDEDPDLAFIDALQAAPPAPGRPNPEPDPPADPDEPEPPEDEAEREQRKPGRD